MWKKWMSAIHGASWRCTSLGQRLSLLQTPEICLKKSTSWWAEEYDPSRQRYVDLGSNRVPVFTPCVTLGETFHTLEAQLNVGVTKCPHRIQRCKCDSWRKEWEPCLLGTFQRVGTPSFDFPFLALFLKVPIRSICVILESNSSFLKLLLATGSASSIDMGDLPGSCERLWMALSEQWH